MADLKAANFDWVATAVRDLLDPNDIQGDFY